LKRSAGGRKLKEKTQEIKNYKINDRYEITYEVGATKGVTGYKVTAKGDDLKQTEMDADNMKFHAEQMTAIPAVTNA
jgi:hypothetical protein